MSQIMTHKEVTPAISANKKPYHTPELKELGNVCDLTSTNSPPPFSGSDGGSFPTNYSS